MWVKERWLVKVNLNMRISIPNEILVSNYTVLTPSGHLNAPRDTHNKDFTYHRRVGSISFKTRANVTAVNGTQNLSTTHAKNGGLKRYFHRRTRTDKHTPIVSPKMFTIKSLATSEIYSNKQLCKSTSQHPKLNSTTALKSGKPVLKARHGSIGSQLPAKLQNCSSTGTGSIRQRRNTLKFLKDTGDFRSTLQKGQENLRLRNFRLAVEHFTRAAEMNPSAPEPFFSRGVAFFELQATAKALQDFEKVAEEWPRYDKSTYLYLSMIYSKIADAGSALASVMVRVTVVE